MPLNDEQKWQLVVVGLTMGIATILSVIFLFVLKSGQGVPVPPTIPNPNLFPDFQPAPNSKSMILYQDFVFQDIISTPNIIKNSRIIKLVGKLESGSLTVKASARPQFCWDKSRVHSVYFYIDNGDSGGQLDSVRENAVIVKGGFSNDSSPYSNTFPLSAVPVAKRVNGNTTIDVVTTLNDNQPHYIGAFVSTGQCGELNEMKIDYECSKETPDCMLEFNE